MMGKNNSLDKRVSDYIDQLFAVVGATQQLFDLKEELTTNLKEKTKDYLKSGLVEEEAFKEAVISMGDLSGLVDELRELGRDQAKKTVYSKMTERISNAGIVGGVLLILFGFFNSAMLFFMAGVPMVAVAGNLVFVVAGGILITYSVLTRETKKKYGMNKIRAALYSLAIGLLLFSLFNAVVTYYAVGEAYIVIGSAMLFFLAGLGLVLYLILTETDRSKE